MLAASTVKISVCDRLHVRWRHGSGPLRHGHVPAHGCGRTRGAEGEGPGQSVIGCKSAFAFIDALSIGSELLDQLPRLSSRHLQNQTAISIRLSGIGRCLLTCSSIQEPSCRKPQPFRLPRISLNRGRIVGPKPPLKPKHIWALRTRLQLANRTRDLALFNLAVDSKLLGCDLVRLRVSDVHLGDAVRLRATVCQQKTEGRCPSRSPSPHARHLRIGWLRAAYEQATGCSRAALGVVSTSRRDTTVGLLTSGSP